MASAVALAVSLFAPRASAYERQWHAGTSLGYALASQGTSFGGLGGGAHLTYGLTDAFNGVAEVDLTAHPGADALIASGSVGATYVFDVLRWVPYAGVMAGGYDLWSTGSACGGTSGIDCHDLRLGVSIPFGIDYQLSRSFAVGFAGRYHVLPGSTTIHYLTAFARAEYLWGY